MKFSQIEYTRVDIDALKAQLTQLIEQLANASSFEETERVYLTMDEAEGATDRKSVG